MTIGSTTNESTGIGNGVLTLFTFDFAVQNVGQVEVYTRTDGGGTLSS